MMEITTNNSIRVKPEFRDRDIIMMSLELLWTLCEGLVQNGLNMVECVVSHPRKLFAASKRFHDSSCTPLPENFPETRFVESVSLILVAVFE